MHESEDDLAPGVSRTAASLRVRFRKRSRAYPEHAFEVPREMERAEPSDTGELFQRATGQGSRREGGSLLSVGSSGIADRNRLQVRTNQSLTTTAHGLERFKERHQINNVVRSSLQSASQSRSCGGYFHPDPASPKLQSQVREIGVACD